MRYPIISMSMKMPECEIPHEANSAECRADCSRPPKGAGQGKTREGGALTEPIEEVKYILCCDAVLS